MVKEKKWFVVSRKEKVAEEHLEESRLNWTMRGEKGREKKRQRGWQAYQGRKHGPRRKEAKRVCSQNDWIIIGSETGGRE